MDSMYILDKLGMEKDCKIEGAIFLTYSIDCKSILAALLKMFTDKKTDKKTDKNDGGRIEKRRAVTNRFQELLEGGMKNEKSGVDAYNELKSRVAFVCNDGYDKSVASPIYWYTKNLTYYYKADYSFHPKLYIVKYSKKADGCEETYFRIMVASMNFVDSHNLDMMMVKDVRAYNDEEKENGEIQKPVQCPILNELLDYKPESEDDNNLEYISNRKDDLKTVIDNLGLHKLWFDEKDLPKFFVFPGNNESPLAVNKIKKVMSPFLTLSEKYALRNKDVPIYTMESELNKSGWFACDEDDEAATSRSFYVYQAEENELQFNHTKLYVVETEDKTESVYMGSTNFSKAAFEKNKEILVELEVQDISAFKEDIFKIKNDNDNKFGYVKKKFKKHKENDENEEYSSDDFFKRLSRILSMKLSQTINKDKDKDVFCCTISMKEDISGDISDNEFDKIKNVLPKEAKINIIITPFFNKIDPPIVIGTIDVDGRKIEKTKVEKFNVDDRRLLDERYIFTYKCGEKNAVNKEYVYSIKTSGLENDEDVKTGSEYMLAYINSVLAEKKTGDSMLVSEFTRLLQGNKPSLSNYCRRLAIPDLEDMLKNWKDDDNYKPNGRRLEEIKELLSEGKLTSTESKNLGVTSVEKKLIDNLCKQWDALKADLQLK
jgi:hypothetical protein